MLKLMYTVELGNMGILTEQSRAWERTQMYNGWMKLKLSYCVAVCVTMSQEDMIFSHVYLYVYVVSLITKLFYKFKP